MCARQQSGRVQGALPALERSHLCELVGSSEGILLRPHPSRLPPGTSCVPGITFWDRNLRVALGREDLKHREGGRATC